MGVATSPKLKVRVTWRSRRARVRARPIGSWLSATKRSTQDFVARRDFATLVALERCRLPELGLRAIVVRIARQLTSDGSLEVKART
jgi:hypothetical protein